MATEALIRERTAFEVRVNSVYPKKSPLIRFFPANALSKATTVVREIE